MDLMNANTFENLRPEDQVSMLLLWCLILRTVPCIGVPCIEPVLYSRPRPSGNQEMAVRQFTQTIAKVLQRHAPVVVYIAQGILELKRYGMGPMPYVAIATAKDGRS